MNEELIAEALIGDEAKKFLDSDFGKTLMGLAQQEATLAMGLLKSADPEDSKTIRSIQNDIWRAEKFEEWLIDLISAGETALRLYQQQEVNDGTA